MKNKNQVRLRYRTLSIPEEGHDPTSFTLPRCVAELAERKARKKKISIAEHLFQMVRRDLAKELPLSKRRIEAGHKLWIEEFELARASGMPFRLEVDIDPVHADQLEAQAIKAKRSLPEYLMSKIDQLLILGLAASLVPLLASIYDNLA